MTLKTLPLESWMQDDEELAEVLESDRYPPCRVSVGRPGIYLEGPLCWFELDAQRAYAYPREDFTYKLRLLDASKLNERQVQALQQIVQQGLATKQQRQLLRDCRDSAEIRNTGRDSRKTFLRMFRP